MAARWTSRGALERLGRRVHEIDWTSTSATPAHRRRRRDHLCRSRRRHGRCIELARAFGSGSRGFDCLSTSTPGGHQARAVKLADVRRGGTRPRARSASHLRLTRPDRLHVTGAVAVGARPFPIAYNINLDSRDVESPSGSLGGPGVRRRAPEYRPRLLGRRLGRRGLLNLLDFVSAALAGLESVRDLAAEDGVELAGVGAHRARSAGPFLPSRTGPTAREDPVERRLRPRPFLRLRDFSRCRRSSFGSRPPDRRSGS
jgi:hypothetical protein